MRFRLLDEENLLQSENRTLEKWNGVTEGQTCSNENSISKNKCQFERESRKRRNVITRLGQETTMKETDPSNLNNMRAKVLE